MWSPTPYTGVVRTRYAAESQKRENAALVSVPLVVSLVHILGTTASN